MVRKKLKWNNKPFEIKQEVLEEWRKIGSKGEQLEKKWQEVINKNSKIKSDLEKNYLKSDLEQLESLIEKEKTKYFNSKPSLATRQCSMAAIETISNLLPQLIGLSLIHI